MLTGIFYHASFSRSSYLTLGNRLRDFPKAFELLKGKKVKIFESPEVSIELLKRVHNEKMIEAVFEDYLCTTALRSAGGVVKATELVFNGELRNAFCYIGAGGHHAGKDYFWGYCCFNDVALALENLFEKFRKRRVAIIDTDAHHGDGTREIVKEYEVLHFCICDRDYESRDGLKVDRSYFLNEYFNYVNEFVERCENFSPELIFWYFGHDTHVGEYADIGMSIEDYLRIAKKLKNCAKKICREKLVTVLGGGSLPDIARDATIAIIKELSE
ncbi:MAG: histone deacetylase [Archaeoglobaceae archaeon]|nr:histone deacetylase [Archaeoglobaceae archaeon]MDW7989055.1 histone deacetylase [Archaeoglobaceae archaeon]